MGTKNFYARKDSTGKYFYHYKTSAFQKFRKEEKDFVRTNIISLNMKMTTNLVDELRLLIANGHKQIEVRQNQIYLRGMHEKETIDKFSDIYGDLIDEESEHYDDVELYEKRCEELNEYVAKNCFIETTKNFFEHGLKDYSVCLKINLDTNFVGIQCIKTFKNGKSILYLNKFKPRQLKAFKALLKRK